MSRSSDTNAPPPAFSSIEATIPTITPPPGSVATQAQATSSNGAPQSSPHMVMNDVVTMHAPGAPASTDEYGSPAGSTSGLTASGLACHIAASYPHASLQDQQSSIPLTSSTPLPSTSPSPSSSTTQTESISSPKGWSPSHAPSSSSSSSSQGEPSGRSFPNDITSTASQRNGSSNNSGQNGPVKIHAQADLKMPSVGVGLVPPSPDQSPTPPFSSMNKKDPNHQSYLSTLPAHSHSLNSFAVAAVGHIHLQVENKVLDSKAPPQTELKRQPSAPTPPNKFVGITTPFNCHTVVLCAVIMTNCIGWIAWCGSLSPWDRVMRAIESSFEYTFAALVGWGFQIAIWWPLTFSPPEDSSCQVQGTLVIYYSDRGCEHFSMCVNAVS
jgi:hypothetical protein